MDDTQSVDEICSTRFHRDYRAADSDCGPLKTIDIKKIGWIALFALLPWNAYAEAQQLPGVLVQSEVLANATAPVDGPSAVVNIEVSGQDPIRYKAETIVTEDTSQDENTVDENLHGSVVNQELASLNVVDTGVLRKVQDQQSGAGVLGGAEAPAVSEFEVNVGTSGEADKSDMAAASVDEKRARNYEATLPVVAVVAETGNRNGQLEFVSAYEASDDVIQLPYAVLLAILALISMIPVARRKD